MNKVRSIFIGALLLTCPAEAQEHRFEADPIVVVRENFVACDVLSQLQRVMQRRMRAAARRRSGPHLREARPILLHLSARPDFTLQMGA